MTEDERRADENERIDYAEGATAMTDIKQREDDAAALEGGPWRALEIEIEAHDATKAEFEAFRRDVSEAVKSLSAHVMEQGVVMNTLSRFILPEPVDPLVEALRSIGLDKADEWAGDIRKAAIAHGLTIQEQQP